MAKKFLQLSEYIEFFDKNNIFQRDIRWIIPDKYNTQMYDIVFVVSNPRKWIIRSLNSPEYLVTMPSKDVLKYINTTPIDITILYSCLHESVREEAVFANMIIKRIRDFLGDEEVDCAIREIEDWSKHLIETVSGILNQENLDITNNSVKSKKSNPKIVDKKEAEKIRKIHIVKD